MMEALAAFHFLRPWWLLALVPVLVLSVLHARLTDAASRWRRVIDPGLLQHLLVGEQRSGRITPGRLLPAVWVLGTVIVAGPAWQREPSPFADSKPPAVVLLKVTPSMMSGDLAPTRLDRARQKLADLVALREGAPTGLIAYAGSTHLVLPPTADGEVVVSLSKALAPEIMPRDGDDLANALLRADGLLSGDERGGSILVMADTVSESEVGLLDDIKLAHPVTFLALLPADQDAASVTEAARALSAAAVATTTDNADVRDLARRLDQAEPVGDVAGEGQHWQEAGYWLTPLLVLLVLGWFRRGWVLS